MKGTCIKCGTRDCHYVETYGYYRCGSCGEVWAYVEDDPDYNELEEVDYGPCCACNRQDQTVRNFLLIEIKTPVPGTRWGCLICNLPADGAIAVVCDACLNAERTPISIAYGYPEEKKRCFINASSEEFKHKDIPHGDEDEAPVKMPDYYDPYFGGPFYWRQEPTGKLEAAILAYIAHAGGDVFDNAKRDRTAPTQEQLSLVIDYLKYWINAPCWQQPEREYWLDRLRARSYSLNTVAEVSNWLNDCLKVGLDPL